MSAGCSVIVYEDEQICQKLRQGVHGFLKVRNFGGEFGEAISFCRFSAKIALSRHKSPDLSSDFEKTIRKPYNAGLSPEETAIMSFVQKIVIQAHQVNEDDIEELRKHGLPDEEILDIVAAATARSFFSKTLDALGAKPDDAYLELEPELIQALALGRPFP